MQIQNVPEPSLCESRHHAIIKVSMAGICGRDIEHYNSVLNPEKVPHIPGHELSGIISELPRGIKTPFTLGDRVVPETVDSVCGKCSACQKGVYNLCKQRKNIGGGMNGAFSSFVKVPLKYLHKLPTNVRFEEGAMVEPTCVCFNAMQINSNINAGDLVVIIGVGTIGIICIQFAKLAGATVVIIGLPEDRHKMEVAQKLGADYFLLTTNNPVNTIMEMTDNFGAPLVIDAVGGVAGTMQQALDIVSPGGQITKIGWFMDASNINLDPLIRKGVTLQGSFSHNFEIWEESIQLIAEKKIDLRCLISGVVLMDEWENAFALLSQKKAIKILMQPYAN